MCMFQSLVLSLSLYFLLSLALSFLLSLFPCKGRVEYRLTANASVKKHAINLKYRHAMGLNLLSRFLFDFRSLGSEAPGGQKEATRRSQGITNMFVHGQGIDHKHVLTCVFVFRHRVTFHIVSFHLSTRTDEATVSCRNTASQSRTFSVRARTPFASRVSMHVRIPCIWQIRSLSKTPDRAAHHEG